jgi:ferric-dicitrate binding protein FerR (iron transport regulator)
MNCHETGELLHAWLDGELDASERDRVDAHLAECEACRAAADEAQMQGAALAEALAPMRRAADLLAAKVVAEVRAEAAAPKRDVLFATHLAALAAGFLLAVTILRPWQSEPRPLEQPAASPIATLEVATGPLEYLAPHVAEWTRCPNDAALPPGAAVRTGPEGRCELAIADGSSLRLNTDTQVRLDEARVFHLAQGQVWSLVVPEDRPFAVEAAGAKVVASGGEFDLACRGDELVLTVLAGDASLEAPWGACSLSAGEYARILGGELVERGPADDAAHAAGWIVELLLHKSPGDPELERHVRKLLAAIGYAKMSVLEDEEIRRLGDLCVLPLVRYLEESAAAELPERRIAAAAIVGDMAQPWAIPDLIELLDDAEPRVRREIARGLLRLTTHDLGRPPEAWQEDLTSCQPTKELWQRWWNENQASFPRIPKRP